MSKKVSFTEGLSSNGKDWSAVAFRRLPSKWLLALLGLPMLIALGISGYLTWVSMTGSEVAGCGGQLFDCSHVIYSKWSKVYGIPVSALATLTYLGMISATAITANDRNSDNVRYAAWLLVTLLAFSAAMAAMYFIFLQVFVLEHLCQWCLGAHACGLLISLVVLVSQSRISSGKLSAVSGLAGVGLALLIGIQVNSEEPPSYEFIELAPEASILASTVSPNESTFTSSPIADEMISEDGFLAPPGVDDGLFAPPVDSLEGLFEPPSEETIGDANSVDVSLLKFRFPTQLDTTAAVVGHLTLPRGLMTSLLVAPPQQGDTTAQQTSNSTEQTAETKQTKQPRPKKKKVRVVQFMGRKINAYQWPIDGSPDAKYIFVEMFDYTCPHCRTTSRAICEVKKQMAGSLSVITLPVPMNTRCNPHVQADHVKHQEACELSTLAVAVWRCDREQFSTFHHWMFEGEDAPTYSDAFAKAAELVGSEAINKEMQKGTASAFVQSHVKMYQLVSGGVVPKLLFPTSAIQGEFTSVEQLNRLILEKAVPLMVAPIPAETGQQ